MSVDGPYNIIEQIITICCWTDIIIMLHMSVLVRTKFQLCMVGSDTIQKCFIAAIQLGYCAHVRYSVSHYNVNIKTAYFEV